MHNYILSQDGMFDLLLECRQLPEKFQYMHPSDKYGTWSLTWNELYDRNSQSPSYNPCRELFMSDL